MSNAAWVHENYNRLVKEYGGRCVLIRDQQVVFADKSFEIVLDYAEKAFPDRKWEMRRIDSGEATFYRVDVSNKRDHPTQ